MKELYVYIKDNEIKRCFDKPLPPHELDGCSEHFVESEEEFESVDLDSEGNIVTITHEEIMQKLNDGDIS